MFCAIHEEHDHFAVCCETIFLKTSSTAVAVVAATVLDDWAAIDVPAEGLTNVNGVLLVVDVATVGAPNGVAAIDVDNDEEDEFESTLGAAPPKANVPNGTAGFVPVVGLPKENFGAAVAVTAAEEMLALSFFKLPNVLAVDLGLSSGLVEPNVNCGIAAVFDVTATAFAPETGFEPNTNVPLAALKSIPPLPNVNFGLDVDASLDEVLAAASLSLVC